MSLAVVRCPVCLGECRVGAEALGEMVACPQCQVPFVAAEEVVPTVQPTYRPAPARPVSPPRRPLARAEPESAPPADEPKVPDPEHDPHLPPVAGLPVSVLVGLSLLPFAIPLLWWAAPVVTGQQAALTLAVPVALAFAASALCLGVVYTIDWSAAARVKGVLTLVGLAYLTAAGLFFLKKNVLDRVQDFFELQSEWRLEESKDHRFRVRLRGTVAEADDQPLPGVRMAGKAATFVTRAGDEYRYLALAGTPDRPLPNAADWYDAVGAHLARSGPVTDGGEVRLFIGGHPGHQWTVEAGGRTRVVQVYAVAGRVYYLSVEGRNAAPTDEDFTQPFFRSFEIVNAKR